MLPLSPLPPAQSFNQVDSGSHCKELLKDFLCTSFKQRERKFGTVTFTLSNKVPVVKLYGTNVENVLH